MPRPMVSGPSPSRASTPARRRTTWSRAPWACWGSVARTCGWWTWTAQRRADLAQLRAFIAEDLAAGRTPVAIVGNAGDVNTGIIDPLPQMAEIARRARHLVPRGWCLRWLRDAR